MPQGIIDPTIGASEYGANIAQWDWKPFSDAMSAAKTTYSMLRQNKVEDQALAKSKMDMEMEKILFPLKKNKAELELSQMQSEIKRTDAMTSYYLGQNDADGLANSPFGSNLIVERLNPEQQQRLAELQAGRKKIPKSAATPTTFNTLGNWKTSTF